MSSVLDKIVNCPSLPSLPAVAIEVLELTRDPNVSIKEIAKVVQNDQAIAAKVLRTINSSYYGLTSPCPTIQRAMGYLGLNSVRSLVLGFSLVDSFKGAGPEEGGFDLQAHWRRALYGATAARTTAHRACCTDPDEAFIASMLQDIGMLASSMALGEEYNEAILEANGDHFAVERIEEEHFGFTHSDAGAMLAERWRLPDAMIEAVRFHHRPDDAPEDFMDLVQTVALSTVAAESLSVEPPNKLVTHFKAMGKRWFEFPVDDAEELLTTITNGASELSRLFQLDTGLKPDVSKIMSEAQEQQIAAQINMERERQTLETTASELEKESLTDGLTGIANRKHFDTMLNEQFELAMSGTPLTVLFMDADKFKSVNDTHGHQAGDAVLVELAQRATEAVGERGVVFRYGGEEFAVIAPGAGRIEGSKIAEAIRKAVEAEPFDLRDVPECPDELPVTISAGVAAIEESVRSAFPDPVALLKAADTAVYAAKKGGRNCTRVYNPAKAARCQHEQQSPERHSANDGSQPQQRAAAQASGARHSMRVVPDRRLCVLLIEDDPMHRSLLLSAMGVVENKETLAASSAEEALGMLGITEGGNAESGLIPDIIITDLTLPGIDGLEMIKRIRSSERHRAVPMIVLSSLETPDESKRCAEAGANACIPKQRFALDPGTMIGHIIGFWTSALLAA